MKALKDAGAKVKIVSLKRGSIKGWNENDWGKEIDVDLKVDEADVDDFDALVLPGGVINPDKLRMNKEAMRFVQQFDEAGKTIAAICHGPWSLIEAHIVKGKTVTSWPSLKTDLRNAGAEWVDKQCAIDGNLITSRNPDDLPAFNQAILNSLAKDQASASTAKSKKESAQAGHQRT